MTNNQFTETMVVIAVLCCCTLGLILTSVL